MSLDHTTPGANESAEALSDGGKMQPRSEIMLLSTEAKLSVLEQAREKYHPKYWYCADLITKAINKGDAASAQSYFTCFDRWIKNPADLAVRDALFGALDLDSETKRRLSAVESARLVETVVSGGESRLEYTSAIALYALLNSPSGTVTTPAQRTYDKLLFDRVNHADLCAVLESILSHSKEV